MSSSIRLLGFVILCVYFISSSAKTWRLQNRIVGGSSAVKMQFPYQVSLRFKITDKHFCGGSIINSQYVLSAGHCLIHPESDKDLIYGLVNMVNSIDQGTRVDFESVLVNHLYEVTGVRSDIALLRTKNSIVFSEFVKPINLPTQEFIEPGTVAFVAGWGRIEDPDKIKGEAKRATNLQFKHAPTLSIEECLNDFESMRKNYPENWHIAIEKLTRIKDSIICTKNLNGTGNGKGDSGSGLVHDNTLIGIVAWSVDLNGSPSIYTKVYPQLPWIHQGMIIISNNK